MIIFKNTLWALSLLLLLSFTNGEKAEEDTQVPAFPGAEGFGRYTTGGRGGKVLIVENLNDSGPGSLREAVEQKFPRIIVFNVSGTIALESELKINSGNITIAGQSAPGGGICIRNYPLVISSDNVIVRYMRIRLGDEKKFQGDAFSGLRRKDIIIDHCSVSWGTDEVATFYDNQNFTLQWSIVSEGLNASVHEKGDHGYGGIWGGMGASFHHNLFAHNSSRNPRFCGARYHKQPEKEIVDLRNNVIYNWKINSAYGGEEGNHNMVNNYFKPGPATNEKVKNRLLNPSPPYGKFYVEGNFIEGSEKISKKNWAGGVHCKDPQLAKSESPFPFAEVKTHSAREAYELILKYSGASLVRDQVDERIADEVDKGITNFRGSTGGTPGILDSQSDAGGWPELASAPVPVDSDSDGIPDKWELEKGLDPKDASDANKRNLDKRYDNVEVYLNELVEKITSGQKGE